MKKLLVILMFFTLKSYAQEIRTIEKAKVYDYVDANSRYAIKVNVVSGKINLDLSMLNISSLNKLISISIVCKQKTGESGIYSYTLDDNFNLNGGDIYIYDCKNNIDAPDGTNIYVSVIYDDL